MNPPKFSLSPRLFKDKSAVFGITYFQADQLIVIFLEKTAAGFQPLGTENMTLAEPLSQELVSSFQARLSRFRARSPEWVHLVLRQTAFVRTFQFPDKLSADELNESVSKRVQEEIPYLIEELSHHYSTDKTASSEGSHVTMYGVSQNVLREQWGRLDRFGMIPQHMFLSTEVLLWIYQKHLVSQIDPKLQNRVILLIHFFGRYSELLFIQGGHLIQSRWMGLELGGEGALGDSIETGVAAFQREFKMNPALCCILAEKSAPLNRLIDRLSFPTQVINPWPDLPLPPVAMGCVETSFEKIFPEFILPEVEERRRADKIAVKREQLSWAVFCLAFSIFLFFMTPILNSLAQIGWLGLMSRGLEVSVKEVKQMRGQAMAVQNFRAKKVFPVLLLNALREAIPVGVLLRELEYSGEQNTFFIRGTALEQRLADQLHTSLSQQPFLHAVTVERVQSQQNENNGIGFVFEIKGSFGRAGDA